VYCSFWRDVCISSPVSGGINGFLCGDTEITVCFVGKRCLCFPLNEEKKKWEGQNGTWWKVKCERA